MPWSGLKSRFKTFLAPSIRDRVDFHVTGYRHAYDQRGKGWITIDGKILIAFCDFVYENALRIESEANGKGPWNADAFAAVKARQILPDHSLGEAMEQVMNHPVATSLRSDNPLVVALAALDRRTGKRRLAAIELQALPEWSRSLITLRLEAERVR